MNARSVIKNYQDTFRRVQVEHLLQDLGAGYTEAYIRRMLTVAEFDRYKQVLQDLRLEERQRPEPKDLLTGNADVYWRKATSHCR